MRHFRLLQQPTKGAVKKVEDSSAKTTGCCIKSLFSNAQTRLSSQPRFCWDSFTTAFFNNRKIAMRTLAGHRVAILFNSPYAKVHHIRDRNKLP